MALGLGIECTAHTAGIAVVKNGKVLVNERDMYTTEIGGIIPTESAKHHERVFPTLLENAVSKSKINLNDLDFISISQGPGLSPCLLAGMRFAKQLSKKIKKPIVPVNHCVAHLEIGQITGAKDPVLLYVSGANTQVIAFASGKYRIFGETLDIGVGNFIDTFGRYAGMGFPAGPKIQELAKNGKTFIEIPYKVKGMDIALSGILTNLKQKLESKKYPIEDLCFSLQETVFAMLVETAERALAHTGKKELLLGGGVGCNSRLQEMCKIMCEERGAKFFCPERQFLVDNAGMVVFLGEIEFNAGIKILGKEIEKLDIKPRERTDDVEVKWK